MRNVSPAAENPDPCNLFWRLDFEQSLRARRSESLRFSRDLIIFRENMRKCATMLVNRFRPIPLFPPEVAP
jgi:hypothetical protein